MIYLVLAVLCSLTLGAILKHTGVKQIDRLSIIAINYATALAWALFHALKSGGSLFPVAPDLGVILLGATNGLLFISAFFLMAFATDVAGLGLTYGVWRLSVVIPFLASWIIWNEVPGPAKLAGMFVAGIAFFMISSVPKSVDPRPRKASPARLMGTLLALFFAGGIVDTVVKAFRQIYGATPEHPEIYGRPTFLFIVFTTALTVGAAMMIYRGVKTGFWTTRKAAFWGVVLGTANYYAAEFFLQAVGALSGPVVFPANSIALVLGSAVLGIIVWRERPSPTNLTGLVLSVVALYLLNH